MNGKREFIIISFDGGSYDLSLINLQNILLLARYVYFPCIQSTNVPSRSKYFHQIKIYIFTILCILYLFPLWVNLMVNKGEYLYHAIRGYK